MSYWIKLHENTIYNEIWLHDDFAWKVFTYLCLMAYKGKPQGVVVTSRYKIANGVFGNNNTVYKALKRLENAKMVTTSATNKVTTIRICNWHKYQLDQQLDEQQQSNNKVTTKEHSYKNKDKDKRIYISNDIVEQVRRIYDFYIKLFNKNPNTYLLTDKRKQKIKARLKDAGEAMLLRAIENISQSPFHTGDNDRGWTADLDFIIRSYEQVEKFGSEVTPKQTFNIKEYV